MRRNQAVQAAFGVPGPGGHGDTDRDFYRDVDRDAAGHPERAAHAACECYANRHNDTDRNRKSGRDPNRDASRHPSADGNATGGPVRSVGHFSGGVRRQQRELPES